MTPCHYRCMLLVIAVIALVGALAGTACSADKPFFYRDGDNPIVFLGDSITEQRMYTAYIEAYVLTRFPTWNVHFRNIGWGGDVAWLARRWGAEKDMQKGFEFGLKRDILALKPQAITVDFGMNDARGQEGTLPRYVEYQTKLTRALKVAGARVALVTPSPEEHYQPDQPGGSAYNNMLWKYSEALKHVATKERVLWVDQYTPFIDVIRMGRASGLLASAEGGQRLIPDGVHPNWAGHLVMATSILKGLNAPADVSACHIDAKRLRMRGSKGCVITRLSMKDGVLRFTRFDHALPMPIKPESQFVLQVPGYQPLLDLSFYELKVSGLDSGKTYDLAVDGKQTASFTAEQLADGVNLSLVAGPITEQSLNVLNMVLDKNNTYYQRWRGVQLGIAKEWQGSGPEFEAKRAAELKRLDGEIAAKEAAINAMRLPKSHEFTLTPRA